MSEPVTIYVTKDADRRGIRAVRCVVYEKLANEVNDEGKHIYPGHATFWHTEFKMTLLEAIADAECRRARKIASLETQLAKVRAMDLTKPVGDSLSATKG